MKLERDVKGIWIPIEIWEDPNLGWFEKVLLAEIDSFDNGEGCYASDETLAMRFGRSVGHISNTITSLRKRKYLKTIHTQRHRRFLRTTFSRFRPNKNIRSDLIKTLGHAHTTYEQSNTVECGGAKPSTNVLFNFGDEYSPFVKKYVHKFEDFIRSSRKLSRRFNRKKWYKEFTILLRELDGDKIRFKRVINAYITTPHDEWTPAATCAEVFRKKFSTIERWAAKRRRQNPEEDGPVITVTYEE